jgi:hypothetical protein
VRCGSSATRQRPDVAKRNELNGFVAWLMGKESQTERGPSRWTFWRRTAWCWNVEPVIAVTGEIYDQIQVDGIYVAGLCALIASAGVLLGTDDEGTWRTIHQRRD